MMYRLYSIFQLGMSNYLNYFTGICTLESVVLIVQLRIWNNIKSNFLEKAEELWISEEWSDAFFV